MKHRKSLLSGCLLALTAGGIGNYFYELAINPATDKSKIFKADHNQLKELDEESDWFEKTKNESIYLTSEDALKLHSYVLKQKTPSNRYIIIAHGYTSGAEKMTAYAKKFYEQGYHVIIPDARGHGKSEGKYIGMGWHERKDMLLWIQEIITQNPEAEIVLFGVSMGAATVMSTAGEVLPSQVKAIIEDCGYTSVKEIFAYQLKQLYKLPSFPFLNVASLVTYARAGYTLGEANMIKQVANATKPMLFIHGTQDAFVPYEMVHRLYDIAPVEKDLLIVEEAGHAESALVAGESYWKTIFSFLEKHLI